MYLVIGDANGVGMKIKYGSVIIIRMYKQGHSSHKILNTSTVELAVHNLWAYAQRILLYCTTRKYYLNTHFIEIHCTEYAIKK